LIFSRRLGSWLLAIWAAAICLAIVLYPGSMKPDAVSSRNAASVVPITSDFQPADARMFEETSVEPPSGLPFPASFYLNPNNLLFLLGILSGVLQKNVKALEKNLGLILFLLGNVLFVATAIAQVQLGWTKLWSPGVLAYGVASFLIVLGCNAQRVQAVFKDRKLLLFIGDASYSIYLIHFPAIRLPAKAFQVLHAADYVPTTVLFLISTAFGVAVGCLLYALVERPMLNYLGARLLKRSATPRGEPTAADRAVPKQA
jgi:peptidoglycan/LPS O-acetylase OafA/YrhL